MKYIRVENVAGAGERRIKTISLYSCEDSEYDTTYFSYVCFSCSHSQGRKFLSRRHTLSGMRRLFVEIKRESADISRAVEIVDFHKQYDTDIE